MYLHEFLNELKGVKFFGVYAHLGIGEYLQYISL